jgi:hypothetical protein
MNEEWIDTDLDEMDQELIAELEKLTGKSYPNPMTCEGFIFILDEIEEQDWTWTLTKMHEHSTMTIYYNGEQVYSVNKCMYRAVFFSYLDVVTDLKNRQLL